MTWTAHGIVALCLVMTAARAADPFPVGRWYSEGVRAGRHVQIALITDSGGDFTKLVRDNSDCARPTFWRERGDWTYANGQYVEITRQVDTSWLRSSSPGYRRVYALTQADGDHFALTEVGGTAWTFARVGLGFAFPPPQACGQ